MKTLSALWYTIRSILFRRRADDDLDEELAFHLAREAALYEHRGLDPAAARREAALHFGGVQRYREECRDIRRARLLDDFASDTRHALRLVRLRPGFAANVILISALGITACSVTFSLVSGILLTPLPFATPDRVAELELQSTEGKSARLTSEIYLRVAGGSPAIEAIAIEQSTSATAYIDGEPEVLHGERMTASYFQVYGITPQLGRAFTASEAEEHTPVVLIGDAEWRTRFKRDSSIIGRHITLDGVTNTIIGVMPRNFRAMSTDEPAIWLPVPAPSNANPSSDVNAIVRIRSGVTTEAADRWLASVIHAKVSSRTTTDSIAATPVLTPVSEQIYGYMRRPILVLFGAVLLVLALVAANVATMFLARSAARESEFSVRRALGASFGREVRQLITESLTLTLLGGILAVVASNWLIDAVRLLGAGTLPRMESVSLDGRVLLFATVAMIFTGIAGGIAPAFAVRRRRFTGGFGNAGNRTSGSRVSSTLVVAQVALSVMLVVGAGLLMKGFLRVVPTNPGFAVDNRAVVSVALSNQPEFPAADSTASLRFIRDVTARMKRVDGVRDVAVTMFVPLTGTTWSSRVQIVGHLADSKVSTVAQTSVSPNYLDVMRTPLTSGRQFTSADEMGAERVGIVNEAAAESWWPGQNPIDRQIIVGAGDDRSTIRVVGVVASARLYGRSSKLLPQIYYPIAQVPPTSISFVATTEVDPRSVSRALKLAVWSVAPKLPIGTSADLASIAAGSVKSVRFFSTAMSMFAIAAVTLSAFGMYGLLAFAVAQRRREIGIRIALGAPARSVGGLVLLRALGLGAAGAAVGILLARGLSRYMASLLVETSATDARVFTLATIAVLLLAVAAAFVPAYQALSTDPIESLRM